MSMLAPFKYSGAQLTEGNFMSLKYHTNIQVVVTVHEQLVYENLLEKNRNKLTTNQDSDTVHAISQH